MRWEPNNGLRWWQHLLWLWRKFSSRLLALALALLSQAMPPNFASFANYCMSWTVGTVEPKFSDAFAKTLLFFSFKCLVCCCWQDRTVKTADDQQPCHHIRVCGVISAWCCGKVSTVFNIEQLLKLAFARTHYCNVKFFGLADEELCSSEILRLVSSLFAANMILDPSRPGQDGLNILGKLVHRIEIEKTGGLVLVSHCPSHRVCSCQHQQPSENTPVL